LTHTGDETDPLPDAAGPDDGVEVEVVGVVVVGVDARVVAVCRGGRTVVEVDAGVAPKAAPGRAQSPAVRVAPTSDPARARRRALVVITNLLAGCRCRCSPG